MAGLSSLGMILGFLDRISLNLFLFRGLILLTSTLLIFSFYLRGDGIFPTSNFSLISLMCLLLMKYHYARRIIQMNMCGIILLQLNSLFHPPTESPCNINLCPCIEVLPLPPRHTKQIFGNLYGVFRRSLIFR